MVGEFFAKSLSFILIPLFAAYLSKADFAINNLVAIIWPVLIIVMGRGFSAYILRGYYDITDGPRFFGTVLMFSMAIAVILALFLHLSGPWIFDLVFKHKYNYRPYLQYAVFFSLFRLFFDRVLMLYRARRKAVTCVILSIILFAANGAAVLIAMFVQHTDLQGILNAQIVAYALVTGVYMAFIIREVSLKWLPGVVRPAFTFTLPLVPHALSSWLLVYISTLFIARNLPAEDLAVYTLAQRLALILAVINTALNQAWSPFIYANARMENFKELFQTNARKLLVFTLYICAIMILFSRELLLLMGKETYMSAIHVLPILLFGYLVQLVYFIYVVHLFYHKNTRLIPIISISTGLITYFLNLWLVPLWGLYGGALSTVVGFILMALLAYLFSKRYIRVNVINWRVVLFILSLVLVITAVYFVGTPLGLIPAILIKGVIAGLIFIIMEWLGLFRLKPFLQTLQRSKTG